MTIVHLSGLTLHTSLNRRLSDLDELIDDEDYTLNNVLNVPTWEPRSKEDMVKNAIECSKGTR